MLPQTGKNALKMNRSKERTSKREQEKGRREKFMDKFSLFVIKWISVYVKTSNVGEKVVNKLECHKIFQ